MSSNSSLLTASAAAAAGAAGFVVSKFLGLDENQKNDSAVAPSSVIGGLCAASVSCALLASKFINASGKKKLGFGYVASEAEAEDVPMCGRAEFTKIFKDLNADLVAEMNRYEMTPDAKKHMARMLDYNVPLGKLNRGLTVMHTAATIKGAALTAEEAKLAGVLGWCIEWMQASFLVSDDAMDGSITRRGQPCWYKQPDIGLAAINDALILLTHIEKLLSRYFGEYEEYTLLHDLITETTYQTELGQLLDLTTQPIDGPLDLTLYTAERHHLIVKYKTSFYSFYAPVAMGMIFAGVKDTDSLDRAREICVKMGVYFQVQDDYLDCYGSPEVIGKVGTDIQDKKCGWLVVQALKRATPAQRKVIEEHYGIDNEEDIETIKALYREMDLEKLYLDYEEKVYKELVADIAKVNTVPSLIFTRLLHKIYKRQK